MSALRGVVGGVLALTFLEAVVSSPSGSKNTGALFTLVGGGIRRLVDPSVPLIPDRRN